MARRNRPERASRAGERLRAAAGGEAVGVRPLVEDADALRALRVQEGPEGEAARHGPDGGRPVQERGERCDAVVRRGPEADDGMNTVASPCGMVGRPAAPGLSDRHRPEST